MRAILHTTRAVAIFHLGHPLLLHPYQENAVHCGAIVLHSTNIPHSKSLTACFQFLIAYSKNWMQKKPEKNQSFNVSWCCSEKSVAWACVCRLQSTYRLSVVTVKQYILLAFCPGDFSPSIQRPGQFPVKNGSLSSQLPLCFQQIYLIHILSLTSHLRSLQ